VLKIPVSKGFSHRIANLEIEPFDHAGVVLFFGSKIVHQQLFVISQGFDGKRSTEPLLQFCQRSGGSGSYAMRLSMA
jgi:hypothetical protein